MADTKEIYVSERVSLPVASAVDDAEATSADAGLASFSQDDFVVSDNGFVKSLQKVGGVQYVGIITAADSTQLTWQLDSSSTASLERPHVGDKIYLKTNYPNTTVRADIIYYAGAVFVITSVSNYNCSDLEPVYTGLEMLYTTKGETPSVEVNTATIAPGSIVSVVNNGTDLDVSLLFSIPTSETIVATNTYAINASDTPYVTYSRGGAYNEELTLNFYIPTAAEVVVGDTTVVSASTNPTVTYDVADDGTVTLKFSLPVAAKVKVGDTIVISPGSTPAVTGTEDNDGNVTLDFKLPTTEVIKTTNLHLLNTWEEGYVEVSKSGTSGEEVTLDFYIPRGYPGQSFHINDVVSSTSGLPTASSDVFGYVYVVGSTMPYSMYVCIYDEDSNTYKWLNLGSIAGISSIVKTSSVSNEDYVVDTYTLTMNDGTILYWTLNNAKYIDVTYTSESVASTEQSTAVVTYTKNANKEYNSLNFDFKLAQGIQGDKGDKGDAATVDVGTVITTTLSSGSSASVTVANGGTINDATFNFTFAIPQGVGISNIYLSNTTDNVDTYTIVLTDNSTYDFTVTNFTAESITSAEIDALFEGSVVETPIYGVSWTNDSTTTMARTDDATELDYTISSSTGTIASDFNNVFPWTDASLVSDDNGNAFIQMPEMYFRVTLDDDGDICGVAVSSTPHDDGDWYRVAPFWYSRYGGSLNGSKLCSVSGVNRRVSTTRADFRTYATNNGDGYCQLDNYHKWVMVFLWWIEFATKNSENIMTGRIVGSGTNATTSICTTGNTDSLSTPSGFDTTTAQMRWHYIEDFVGNMLEWLDGITWSANNLYVSSTPDNYSDSVDSMELSGITRDTSVTNNCIKAFGWDSSQPFLVYPSKCLSNTSYNTGFCDYALTSNSSFVVVYSGASWRTSGSDLGLVYFHAGTASASDSDIGGRLLKWLE